MNPMNSFVNSLHLRGNNNKQGSIIFTLFRFGFPELKGDFPHTGPITFTMSSPIVLPDHLEFDTTSFIVLGLHGLELGYEMIYFAAYSPDRIDLVREHLSKLGFNGEVERVRIISSNSENGDGDGSGKTTYRVGVVAVHRISNLTPMYTKEDGKQYAGVFEVGESQEHYSWSTPYGATQMPYLAYPGLTDAQRTELWHKEYHRIRSLTDGRVFWNDFPVKEHPESMIFHNDPSFAPLPHRFYELPFNPETIPQDCLDYAVEYGNYIADPYEYRLHAEKEITRKLAEGTLPEEDGTWEQYWAWCKVPNPIHILKRTTVENLTVADYYDRYGHREETETE
jgi:hypothetical protein